MHPHAVSVRSDLHAICTRRAALLIDCADNKSNHRLVWMLRILVLGARFIQLAIAALNNVHLRSQRHGAVSEQDYLRDFMIQEAQCAGIADTYSAKDAPPASVKALSMATISQLNSALTPSTGLTGERTVWATGPLSPPPALAQCLQACLLLHVRLAAHELVCTQVPPLT